MRYMIKGGIWKNTEDEILKAAVMKYGLNQWSRISSLLVRKSAKECKARWYEWLDPSIKKTEWTREEEEKLLHLTKIFPAQWRTIAPIIGRTPAQCIEHYEKLLDRAQGKEEEMTESDPRRLRPGEIDPNPESKPARPDETDMDEDVKEMLQEARARLANTKGKKAKRKLRERILEEARRLASLQKKRELKAAGIEYTSNRKIRGVNYNLEIPFKREVPEGRFGVDVSESPIPDEFKSNISLQQMKGERRDDEYKIRKLKDQKKMKKLKDKDLPKAMSIINKMNEGGLEHNRKIVLPSPQLTDADLTDLSKITNQGAQISDAASHATKPLIGQYTSEHKDNILGETPLRIKTPRVEERINNEALNAAILREANTPLIGGTNKELKETTPNPSLNTEKLPKQKKTATFKTPNTLKTRINSARAGDSNSLSMFKTPVGRGSKAGAPQTPPQGEKVVGEKEEYDRTWEGEEEMMTNDEISERVREGLGELPAPQKVYRVEGRVHVEEVEEGGVEEDMEDVEKRRVEESRRLEERERGRRSQVIQRGFPRPFVVVVGDIINNNNNINKNNITKETEEARVLLALEMERLISHDNSKYPGDQIRLPKHSQRYADMEELTRKEYIQAGQMIDRELKLLHPNNNNNNNSIEIEYQSGIWEDCMEKLGYFPGGGEGAGEWGYLRDTAYSLAQNVESLKHLFIIRENALSNALIHADGLETAINRLLKEYYTKVKVLQHQIDEQLERGRKLKGTYNVYNTLIEQEGKSIIGREEKLKRDIKLMEETENLLQERYDSTNRHKLKLMEEIGELYIN